MVDFNVSISFKGQVSDKPQNVERLIGDGDLAQLPMLRMTCEVEPTEFISCRLPCMSALPVRSWKLKCRLP